MGSRLIIAIISFVLLLLNANFLGAEGLGTVGLIVLGITIVLLVSGFMVGGGMVYFAARYSAVELLILAYLWSIFTALLFVPVVLYTNVFPTEYAWDVLYLGLLQSGTLAHQHLLLGKEKVKHFNTIALVQSISQLIGLLVVYFYYKAYLVEAFVECVYYAYIFSYVLSFILSIPQLKGSFSKPMHHSFWEVFRYGFYLQMANIFQLLNYRLSYYLLQFYSGRAAVGIYSAGVQLSEGMLLPVRSIGMVQYSRISNMEDLAKARKITIALMKASVLITLPLLLIIILLPTSFFVFLFGEEFDQVDIVIASMSVGILSLSAEGILSRYFSGTGKQQVNTINAIVGLLCTLGVGLWLVPLYGALGAAYTASIAYSLMFIYLFWQLNKYEDVHWKDFLPQKGDLAVLKKLLKQKLKQSN